MTKELKGKTALIVGAASGIGAACAISLAEAGADVILADCNDTSEVFEKVATMGVRVIMQQCDIANEDSIKELFVTCDRFASQLDIVLNSAGILIESSVETMAMLDFDRMLNINLRGTFLLGKYALPRLNASGGGRFIAIASELVYPGRADFSAYCASKAGVIGLVKSWAREFAPDVLVNAIAPGPVDTPMLNMKNMSQENIDKEVENPLGRIGNPEEISATARFLAGPSASFFTGQTISPNGGAVMC